MRIRGALVILAVLAGASLVFAEEPASHEFDAGQEEAIIAASGVPERDAWIAHGSPISFPTLGKTVTAIKVIDLVTGDVVPVYMDESMTSMDIRELERQELAAYDAVHGKKHHLLTAVAARASADALIPVAIWLADPDLSPALNRVQAMGHRLDRGRPVDGDINTAQRALVEEKSRIYVAHNQVTVNAVAAVGGVVDYSSAHAPLVFAKLTPAQIAQVELFPGIQRIYTVPELTEKTEIANPAGQNNAAKAIGHAGTGHIAIVESGKIDFANPYLNHLADVATSVFRPAGSLSEHTTNVAGCIVSKKEAADPAYPTKAVDGAAPGAPRVLNANYEFQARYDIIEPFARGNGVADSTAQGDDVQEIAVGTTGVAAGTVIVSPGANGVLNTIPAADTDPPTGDDIGHNNMVGNLSNIVAAMDWALSEDAWVFNLSIGEAYSDLTFDVSDKYLDHMVFEHGRSVCVAASNECGGGRILNVAGGNTTVDTGLAGDDVYVPPYTMVGSFVANDVNRVIIDPGPDDVLDSVPAGDDVYNIRATDECKITSPGLAYNAITVGATDDIDTGVLGDDVRARYSCYVDLSGDYEKPEISAPGSRIFTTSCDRAGVNCVSDANIDANNDGIRDTPTQGTSFSTPIVTGLVSTIQSTNNSLKTAPETVKAIVLASAQRNSYDHAIERFNDKVNWDPREGAGTVWFDKAHEIVQKGHYETDTKVAGDFPIERMIAVPAGGRFRYAIAWSTHTSGGTPDNITNDELTADLDITVFDSANNLVTYSNTVNNAYEVVAFDSPTAETYRVRISAPRFDALFEYLGQAWDAEVSPRPDTPDKTRFISLTIPEAASGQAALRVRLAFIHRVYPPYSGGAIGPFLGCEGKTRWVGPPGVYVESSSSPTRFVSSTLQTTPHYRDWSSYKSCTDNVAPFEYAGPFNAPFPLCTVDAQCPAGESCTVPLSPLLHVGGSSITPSSIFAVEIVPIACQGNEAACTTASSPLQITTTRWGDVTAPYNPPSTSVQPDITDVSVMVDKFRSSPGAPIKARALLGNSMEPNDFGFGHISLCVDAYRGRGFPVAPECATNP